MHASGNDCALSRPNPDLNQCHTNSIPDFSTNSHNLTDSCCPGDDSTKPDCCGRERTSTFRYDHQHQRSRANL